MKSRDFAFWLQRFFEVARVTQIDANQTELIKKHLALVFKHEIDPEMGAQAHQDDLNKTHGKPDGPVLFRC